jgi:hypothetical protein
VHQAFVEVKLPNAADSVFHLRVGRQEINLGSSRLVGIREGPNVRQSYDGGRLAIEHSHGRVDLLAVRPAIRNIRRLHRTQADILGRLRHARTSQTVGENRPVLPRPRPQESRVRSRHCARAASLSGRQGL